MQTSHGNQTMTQTLCAALLATFLAVLSPILVADPLPGFPTRGDLTYDLMKGEDTARIGKAEHRWLYLNGRYQMELAVQTTGLLDLIYHFEYTQKSSGRQGPDGLIPDDFAVLQTRRQDQTVRFDWPAGKVHVTRKGKTEDYPITPGTQDVLSIWHWVMQVKGSGKPMPAQFSVVTNRRVYTVAATDKGPAKAKIRGGTRDAHHIQLRATNGKLALDLWLDPAHWWLPLRILMVDDKGLVIDQQITPESLATLTAPAQK